MVGNDLSVKPILIVECGSWKKTFFLDRNIHSLGRNSTNTIFCHHRIVSRIHAHLIRLQYQNMLNPQEKNSVFWIVDGDFLGNRSTNGIYVNGRKCTCALLSPGDIIFLGGMDVKAKYDLFNPKDKSFYSGSNRKNDDSFSLENLANAKGYDPYILSEISDERLEFFEIVSQGIILANLDDNKIIRANSSYCSLSGYTPAEITSIKLTEIELLEREIFAYNNLVLKKHPVAGYRESFHIGKNKKPFPVVVKSVPVNYNGKICVLMSVEDVSQVRKLEEVLKYQVCHDSPTNLPNKNLLEKQFAWLSGFNSVSSNKIAVIRIKINNWLKIANEIEDGEKGVYDKTIQTWITVLKESLSSLDCLSRYSEDEYIILKEEVRNKEEVENIIQKLLKRIETPIVVDNKTIIFSVNMGISIYPDDGKTLPELLKNAGKALDFSYNYSGNSYIYYQEILNEHKYRQKVNSFVISAIERNNLQLRYTPIVNAKTGNLHGFTTQLGIETETEFISEIEVLKAIREVNSDAKVLKWCLKEVIRDYQSWQGINSGGGWDLRVNIKVLLSTLFNPHTVSLINDLLSEEENYLPIELDLVCQPLSWGKKEIETKGSFLKNLPLDVCLWDMAFGETFQAMLDVLRVKRIKIPPSLVESMQLDPHAKITVSGIIKLANSLGLEVIAEGVNNPTQREILLSLGCEKMQGDVFYTPLLSCEVGSFCRQNFAKLISS
ncbi:MAG: EAL domain-containing protein [Geminocystis sp.]|nr:EAL domain-containing protein [Geminocystis sp.]HIK37114.1 EAL domain-containing protein [Geminocystis sp. M7585_C2015_104]MCS7147517.1 EAL domain-containing protein [Geminocystis sp.]MCX8077920.1 EAL domain-containing protein [Geminocystis sp.]MDW8115210.1 EAL domain-containing protein [Geminocystis sp.]